MLISIWNWKTPWSWPEARATSKVWRSIAIWPVATAAATGQLILLAVSCFTCGDVTAFRNSPANPVLPRTKVMGFLATIAVALNLDLWCSLPTNLTSNCQPYQLSLYISSRRWYIKLWNALRIASRGLHRCWRYCFLSITWIAVQPSTYPQALG